MNLHIELDTSHPTYEWLERQTDKIGAIPAHMLTGQNDSLAGQVPKDA